MCSHRDGSPCHCQADRLLKLSGRIDSDYLLADRTEVEILHAGEIYRLRKTRNGKLILNK